MRSACPESLALCLLNPIDPPWYVIRMPGGVTGKGREGLPMSIIGATMKSRVAEFP